jgi:hypothetical protein
MKTSLKDRPRVCGKLKGMHVSDDERVRLAKALDATPEERWRSNEKSMRGLGFEGRGMEGKRDFDACVEKHGVSA